MPQIYYTYLDSPVGDFLIAGTERALAFTGFTTGHQQREPHPDWREDAAPLHYALPQFEAYFDGAPVAFDIPFAPSGTPFQLRVWQALRGIRYGQTATYGDIARALGNPGASRAVGAANGANHLPIVVPCHRIIGTDGSLTGFGGGVETKRALLRLEGVMLRNDQPGLFDMLEPEGKGRPI